MSKQGASDKMPRIPETGWSWRAGICPHIKGSAKAGWEEWEAKGWVLGEVQLGAGGSREGSRDCRRSRRGARLGKGHQDKVGRTSRKSRRMRAGKRLLDTGWNVAYTGPVLTDLKPGGAQPVTPPAPLCLFTYSQVFIRQLE